MILSKTGKLTAFDPHFFKGLIFLTHRVPRSVIEICLARGDRSLEVNETWFPATNVPELNNAP